MNDKYLYIGYKKIDDCNIQIIMYNTITHKLEGFIKGKEINRFEYIGLHRDIDGNIFIILYDKESQSLKEFREDLCYQRGVLK